MNGLGIDNHLRQTSATTGVSYFLTDHVGSTSALSDASANLVEQVEYDSFGNSAGSTRTRYTYTGRERVLPALLPNESYSTCSTKLAEASLSADVEPT